MSLGSAAVASLVGRDLLRIRGEIDPFFERCAHGEPAPCASVKELDATERHSQRPHWRSGGRSSGGERTCAIAFRRSFPAIACKSPPTAAPRANSHRAFVATYRQAASHRSCADRVRLGNTGIEIESSWYRFPCPRKKNEHPVMLRQRNLPRKFAHRVQFE